MTSDLENTLAELGGPCRALVLEMKARCTIPAGRLEAALEDFHVRSRAMRAFLDARSRRAAAAWRWPALLAASAALAFGFYALMRGGAPAGGAQLARRPSIYTAAYSGESGARAIVATQRADGSWENDFLTRQNAAALRGVAGASVAYRKAVRYLRSRGLAPLSDDELQARSLAATRRI